MIIPEDCIHGYDPQEPCPHCEQKFNKKNPLEKPLRDLIRFCTHGEDRYDSKNPYCRKEVVAALKALKEETGFKGAWVDANKV